MLGQTKWRGKEQIETAKSKLGCMNEFGTNVGGLGHMQSADSIAVPANTSY
jgi:hypothetical protein